MIKVYHQFPGHSSIFQYLIFFCRKSTITPIKQYSSLLQRGFLKPDAIQFSAVNQLQVLYNELKSSGFSRDAMNDQLENSQKGLYLHGGVGSGKTLLMDLFYDSISMKEKSRVHFNMFMLYLYSEINRWNLCCDNDVHFLSPTEHIAQKILETSWLICFDEVQLADYSSSSLLSSVFQHMFSKGAVIVATSNRSPKELGESAISEIKDKKMFSCMLEENCLIHHLHSNRDYRARMKVGECRFLYPNIVAMDDAFDQLFARLIPNDIKVQSSILEVYGRKIHIPLSAGKVARLRFNDLCCQPLGPADFMTICNAFSIVFIDHIPQMTLSEKNEARRFLSLIDAAYECRTQVYCSAQASIDELFQMLHQDLNSDKNQMHMDRLAEIAFDLNLHNVAEKN